MVELAPQDYAATRYLEYAMSVVTGRALPSVVDGQKPVQRRILYAMHRMGLYRSPKHVKSARVVGDVIGKYHPHGDSSVYDAMVRMAQDWSLRYPLVDGQGNFGSRDGDGSAAMRYTEARLTPIAELLLSELDEGTVDWKPNYDGVNQEPALLPARLPMVLLNGASGIAVGMATEMPAHNLREVASAAALLVRAPETSDEEILAAIPGPDYPGGGQIISSPEEIQAAYRVGRGSLRVRARWDIEQLARGQWRLAITELPPGVSAVQVMLEIEACSNPVPKEKGGKKVFTPEQLTLKSAFLGTVGTIRDEAGKEHAVRLVIEPASSKVSQDELIRLLLAHTSLECNAPVNFTLLQANGSPRQMPVVAILREWCSSRVVMVRRRTEFRLANVLRRMHILEGRQAILINIDEAIRIIREADEPKADLMRAFKLSEVQAEDILEIRLRQLARLEGIKIDTELAALEASRAGLQKLLDSELFLRRQVAKEIEADAKTYGDDRRTLIEPAARVTLAEVNVAAVADDPITVLLSKNGWLRARAGHKVDPATISWKDGDGPLAVFEARTSQVLALLDSGGRIYNVSCASLPTGRGDGVPWTALIDGAGGTLCQATLVVPSSTYLIAQSGGYGFRCSGEDLLVKQKAGKAFLTLLDQERPLPILPIEGLPEVVFGASSGKVLICACEEIKQLPKGKGVQLMALGDKETLTAIRVLDHEGMTLATTPSARKKETQYLLAPSEFERYRGKRARAGAALPDKRIMVL